MIIDPNNFRQRNILTNKYFYQTTSKIMSLLEEQGIENTADEALKVISAYRDIVTKRSKNKFNTAYNRAFKQIDKAIESVANKVFYDSDIGYDKAYRSFESFDHLNAILGRQRNRKK
jgi:hypothetical protein